MRFADPSRRAIAVGVRRAVLSAAALLMLTSCADGFVALSSADAPIALSVMAVRKDAVRVTWEPVAQPTVVSYVIQRRADLSGPFVEVAQVPQSNLSQVVWIDTDVQPETFYGYRVLAVTDVGDRSAPSVIGGARTPPLPGIEIGTTSVVTVAEALDPDGYEVLLAGPDTVRATLGVDTKRRFSPLRPGRYAVTLNGVVPRCTVSGASTVQVDVTDTTATTITPVEFQITCRDPSRGDIAVAVNVTGGKLDDSFQIDVLGSASDTTLPPAQRVTSLKRDLPRTSPNTIFTNIRPGSYTVTIDSVASNCSVQGTRSRTAPVSPLATASITFNVSCVGDAPPPSNAPFIWRNRWSPKSAATNASDTLDVQLDLSARAGQGVRGVQAQIFFDPTVLRFEEEIPGQLRDLTVGTGTPGRISMLAATTGSPRTGVVSIAKFRFTVIGSTGARSITSTQSLLASNTTSFADSIRIEEDTFTVVTGGVTTNQRPVARAGGPYSGTAGTPLTLTGAGSTDPDGTIASYAWAFGDNTTGTGVGPSKTYAAAGTYSATLTVTDDKGATATSTATVTISAGGGGVPAPIARANGPYTATAGAAVTLSSAGSTNATSYSWALGNGQTATGVAPSVTYAAPGTYTITLTATGAGGQTSTSTTTIVVAAAPAPPPPPPPPSPSTLEWKNLFGPFDVVNNTVSITILYDTRVNLAETPGAEALERFAVDSLKWDPSVLQFVSINLGPNINGTSNQVGATAGRLGLQGTIGGAQQQGLITIATIRLRPVGAPNSTTTTKTFLGALLGPSSTNFFSYNAKTTITEGQFTVP